jgi:cobaltochelatase CobS
MPNKMRTFMCETCGAAFQVPVHRGRHHTKCEIHRPAASAPRATRSKATPKAEPVTVQSVAAKATGDPVADALVRAQEQVAALAAAVAERQAQAEAEAAQAQRPARMPMPEGLVHKQFGKLLREMRVGNQPYLCGPSGSGKSYAARQAAKAIGARSFDIIACNAETSSIDFFGYVDANGNYVPGIILDAWTFGGVVLFDEADACDANAFVKLNAVLAMEPGDDFRFPNGERIPRHPEFIAIAAGNTNGHGASAEYTARETLDASSLTRFTYIEWDYDEDLERAMIPADCQWWVERVQALRKAARAASAAIIIDPRVTIHGARLIQDGEADVDEIHHTCLWKGAPEDTRRAVLAHV